MVQWANGADITYDGDSDILTNIGFHEPLSKYEILPDTHLVNNIEVPSPYATRPKDGTTIFYICSIGTISSCVMDPVAFGPDLYSIGNCFKTKEDASRNSAAIWLRL